MGVLQSVQPQPADESGSGIPKTAHDPQKWELPRIRFHDLRHTFATHATKGGVDPKTLSGILGHTNASFTLDTYTHVTGDMQKNAAAIVGGMVKKLKLEDE